jgi:hypothetical protein
MVTPHFTGDGPPMRVYHVDSSHTSPEPTSTTTSLAKSLVQKIINDALVKSPDRTDIREGDIIAKQKEMIDGLQVIQLSVTQQAPGSNNCALHMLGTLKKIHTEEYRAVLDEEKRGMDALTKFLSTSQEEAQELRETWLAKLFPTQAPPTPAPSATGAPPVKAKGPVKRKRGGNK